MELKCEKDSLGCVIIKGKSFGSMGVVVTRNQQGDVLGTYGPKAVEGGVLAIRLKTDNEQRLAFSGELVVVVTNADADLWGEGVRVQQTLFAD